MTTIIYYDINTLSIENPDDLVIYIVKNSKNVINLSKLSICTINNLAEKITTFGNIYIYKIKLNENLLNSIPILPESIKKLSIQKNNICTISNLNSNLTHLNLSYNNIKKIESTTFNNMTQLIILKLEGNKIKNIESSTFKELAELKNLNLASNKIETLDDVIFPLKLEYLNLLLNKLIKLDNSSNLLSRLSFCKKIYIL